MPVDHPIAVVGLDLLHDSDLGVQAFARHVGELLPIDRARLVVAGMRGALEGKADLSAEAAAAFPGLDLATASTGADVVATLAAAAGLSGDQISAARTAATHDLARSAWTVGPAPGLSDLRHLLTAHGVQLATTSSSPIGVPEVLDAIEMPDLPWLVVAPERRRDWWLDAVRPDDAAPAPTPPVPAGHHLVIAGRPADLVAPSSVGVTTGLVDRFGRAADGDPSATWTARDLTGLLPAITDWLEHR